MSTAIRVIAAIAALSAGVVVAALGLAAFGFTSLQGKKEV